MKLATHLLDQRATFSVLHKQTLVPLQELYRAAGLAAAPDSLQALIDGGSAALKQLQTLVQQLVNGSLSPPAIALDQVVWLPAVPRPGKILAVAMNNRGLTVGAHKDPAGPMFFLKPPSALNAHLGAIEIQSDYGLTFPELELGAVIGKRARHVRAEDALSYIFGYTIVNDVTSQGLKAGDSIAVDVPAMKSNPRYASYFSWRHLRDPEDSAVYLTYHTRSKGCDSFGPVGPFVTEASEVDDPNQLPVRGYLDGEPFAQDNTRNYAHSVQNVIAYASRYLTLEPGDLIFFGTSAQGVGRFERGHLDVDMSQLDGKRIDIEIGELGRLCNIIRHVNSEQA
jgi:2-keto-4-pentenoate hydratase/2-oxohepta-3-ene-1,7-dioic acid hydratase in catechol pathway